MTLPKWFVVLSGIYGVVSFGLLLCFFLRGNPLPFPDRGNRIFVCPDEKAQHVTVEVFKRLGIAPRFRLDSPLVKRAILWDGTIINVTDPRLLAEMGNPGGGPSVVVDDPLKRADEIATFLRENGFDTAVLQGEQHGAPAGTLAFVSSSAFHNWVLVLRKHITQMGPMPPAWE